jgi:hypothetical protein
MYADIWDAPRIDMSDILEDGLPPGCMLSLMFCKLFALMHDTQII